MNLIEKVNKLQIGKVEKWKKKKKGKKTEKQNNRNRNKQISRWYEESERLKRKKK